MIKRILLIIFVLLCYSFLFAQKNHDDVPLNIEPIPNKFSFAPYYFIENSYLSISSLDFDRPSIYYKPNTIGNIGAKVGIKNFSLSYSFSLPQPSKYGETKSSNYTLNWQKRIFGISIFYINYKGMYLSNPEELNMAYADDNYPTRPDINLNTFGFNIRFAFNKAFSVKAAFEQNERQRKTAGSFMLGFGDRFSILNSDSSLIVKEEQKYYERTSTINKLNVNTLKLAFGEGYTFIIKRYFSFSTIVLTGWGLQSKFYEKDGSKRIGARLPFYITGKSALGYNGKSIFVNLIYSLELNNIKFTDSKMRLFSQFFKISLGYRILGKANK